MWNYIYTDELLHWGIKGQKWGVRRYTNNDGTLTSAGKKRYGVMDESTPKSQIPKRYGVMDESTPKPRFQPHSTGSTGEILAKGAIGVLGAKGVFALAGTVASLSGKKQTAKILHRFGDYAMIGGAIATSVKLIKN